MKNDFNFDLEHYREFLDDEFQKMAGYFNAPLYWAFLDPLGLLSNRPAPDGDDPAVGQVL